MERKTDRGSCMGINQVKVSVIMPMYNVSKVMKRSIESLYAQTLSGIELIFVDDCSKDNTLSCLETLLLPKEGIEVKIVRHENNRGVAAARNTGLDHATGEYVYYVDADDYIEPATLEKLYNKAQESDADIVGCEWFLTFQNNERLMKQAHVSTGDELFTKMAHGVMRWNLWLFLVKRSLYETNGFRFMEGMNMGEDMMVMMKLALQAHKVEMIHEPLYHYIQTNSGSLTKNFSAYRYQVTGNAEELGNYMEKIGRNDMEGAFMQLKLTLKLPLLISDKVEDFETWLNWFPESNNAVDGNQDLPWRTRFIQKVASKKHFWILKLYYWLVIKLVYGIIYR